MLPKFGLITEGVTDQIILKNILIGYFKDNDLIVRPLQPALDTTDEVQMSIYGGWYNVFRYCQSEYLLGAFEQNDFLIIQIDSDCSHETHYDVPKIQGETLEHYVARIQKRLQTVISEQITEVLYAKYAHRIIFAISVDEIECWLLPLVYTDKIQMATNNCLFKLNQKLEATINPNNKDKRIYQRISRDLMKNKILLQAYPKNHSFQLFMAQFIAKVK
jgi:hypothetical protein